MRNPAIDKNTDEGQRLISYLDEMIRYWRKNKTDSEADSEKELIAMCYVDAFQSVRTSVFGELKPAEEEDSQ